jgi:hypothetical protein
LAFSRFGHCRWGKGGWGFSCLGVFARPHTHREVKIAWWRPSNQMMQIHIFRATKVFAQSGCLNFETNCGICSWSWFGVWGEGYYSHLMYSGRACERIQWYWYVWREEIWGLFSAEWGEVLNTGAEASASLVMWRGSKFRRGSSGGRELPGAWIPSRADD